jgi:secreted trypsin-like serine protease
VRRTIAATLTLMALLPAAAAHAVVGGRDASRPYPHMAALRVDGDFICGASLVAPSWVLTAAHCVREDSKDVEARRLTFTLGRRQLDGPGGETIGAAEVVVHERYGDPKASSHDVALVRLVRPAAETPVALATAGTWGPATVATVTGWGSRATFDVAGVTTTNDLQEVEVPIRGDDECARSYGLTGEYDPGTMLCAGRTEGFADACQGDSGGPLMVPAGGALRLAGVVSFGTGCGLPTQYGVYAKVGAGELRDWVVSHAGIAEGAGAAPAAGAPAAPASAPRPSSKHKPKPKAKKKKHRKARSCTTRKGRKGSHKRVKRCRTTSRQKARRH